ncbi:MAG: hypothetical protein WA632_12540 [Gallionella sp.]
MSTVMLDMGSYTVERVSPDVNEVDTEYLDSAWVPALSQQEFRDESHADMPLSLVNVDVEEFLKKMYESQR